MKTTRNITVKERVQVKRGMIFLADLYGLIEPTCYPIKPILILQNDKGNQFSSCTIAVVSSGRKDENGLLEWDINTITTLDCKRLIRCIGLIKQTELCRLHTRLSENLLGNNSFITLKKAT